MNVRLLRKVAKHIADEPKRLAMSGWLQKKEDQDDKVYDGFDGKSCKKQEFAQCGTAACIAGWTAFLVNPMVQSWEVPEVATEALNIEGDGMLGYACPSLRKSNQSQRLFHVRLWPKALKLRYRKAKTPRGKASAAVARIEHFIATKGKE